MRKGPLRTFAPLRFIFAPKDAYGADPACGKAIIFGKQNIYELHVVVQHHRHHQHKYVFIVLLIFWNN